MPGVHVSTQSNFVFPGFMTLFSSKHDFLAPPPAPTPTPIVPTIEIPVPVMWPVGFGLQQNKLTTTVVHKMQFFMLEGHDCGYLIPHISNPPVNLMLPIIIGFSSRKALFSASKVKANGTAVGCSQLLPLPLPMMTCASPWSEPTSLPPTNMLNNVEVGMTVGDALAGLVNIGLTIAFELLSYWLASKKKLPFFENALNPRAAAYLQKTLGMSKASATIYGKAFGGLAGKFLGGSSVGTFAAKTAAASAVGAAKFLLTDEGSAKIAVGTNYLGGSYTLTRTLDGKKQYTGQVQAGTLEDGGRSASASAQHSINADGTTTNQTATTTASQEGQHQHKSKTDYDAEGKEKKKTDTDVDVSGETVGPNAGNASVHQIKTTSAAGRARETSSSEFSGGGSSPGFWGENL
jgi:hypothetical protein